MWVPGGLGGARDLSGRFPFSLVVVFIMCVYVLFSTSPPLFEPEWTLRFSLLSYFFVFLLSIAKFQDFFFDFGFPILLTPTLAHVIATDITTSVTAIIYSVHSTRKSPFFKKMIFSLSSLPLTFSLTLFPSFYPFPLFPLRNSPLPTLPFPSPSYLSFTSAPLTSFT